MNCSRCDAPLPVKKFYISGRHVCDCGAQYKLVRRPTSHTALRNILANIFLVFSLFNAAFLLDYIDKSWMGSLGIFIGCVVIITMYATLFFYKSSVVWQERLPLSYDVKIIIVTCLIFVAVVTGIAVLGL